MYIYTMSNKKAGRPRKTGNAVTRQMNVSMPEYMMEQLAEKGKTTHISFSGYVRILIENDLKDVPTI